MSWSQSPDLAADLNRAADLMRIRRIKLRRSAARARRSAPRPAPAPTPAPPAPPVLDTTVARRVSRHHRRLQQAVCDLATATQRAEVIRQSATKRRAVEGWLDTELDANATLMAERLAAIPEDDTAARVAAMQKRVEQGISLWIAGGAVLSALRQDRNHHLRSLG